MTTASPNLQIRDRFAGVLLGTAVGDAIGLPYENLSPKRIRKQWSGLLQMRLFLGKGMISDDTEHTVMVAQTLLSHPRNPVAFQRSLAWKLRWWFAGLPGGVGMATAKACLRLWIGFPADKSAVKSAGSGTAMRSAIIGVFFADDPEQRRAFTLASSRLTHRSWQAEIAALAVAEVAALAVRNQGPPNRTEVITLMRALSQEREWQTRISEIEGCLASDAPVADYVSRLGLAKGVTGYALHVVPVAVYAWLCHPCDFPSAMSSVIACGGDTDTVGAILGALCGATGGSEAIPAEWIDEICDWPRSTSFMKRLAERLASQTESRTPLGPVPYFWPAVLPRNVVFLAIVLAHGFRRLAPPY
jgi:ADP-ribosylglycohydrolase